MNIPADLRYSKEHEWAQDTANGVRVGITEYAQKELGDVVFIELPEVGRQLKRGQSFGVVESVKAVSDIYSPVDGKVVARNDELSRSPETVNKDPYGAAWMIVIEPVNKAQLGDLMTSAQYGEHIGKS